MTINIRKLHDAYATRLTRKQLGALRSVAEGRGCSPYMHKILRGKGLMFSYIEETNKGREVLRKYAGVNLG